MTSTRTPHDSIANGTIIVAVDGSAHADRAVIWSAEEAQVHRRRLTILHVERALPAAETGWLLSSGIPLSQIRDAMRADSELMLERARDLAITTAPGIELETSLRVGDARDVLLDLGHRASMIVVGSRGRGPVSSLLLGSVSIDVSRRATCPVTVVRPSPEAATTHGVLVGTEGSSRSVPTLEIAFAEASARHVPLTVVHGEWEALTARAGWTVADRTDPFFDAARARVAEVLAGLTEKFPDVQVDVEITKGMVDHCLADLSRSHQLTVLGRHARTLMERFGSMALTTSIVEHAFGPVLIVP